MPFPTARGKKSLTEIVSTAQGQLIGLKDYTESLLGMLSSPVSPNQLLDYLESLRQATTLIVTGLATPGLPEFIQSQFYDSSVDLVAEAKNLLASVATAQGAVIAAIPVDGQGYIQKDILMPDGSVNVPALQPAQLTALIEPLQQLIAAID